MLIHDGASASRASRSLLTRLSVSDRHEPVLPRLVSALREVLHVEVAKRVARAEVLQVRGPQLITSTT